MFFTGVRTLLTVTFNSPGLVYINNDVYIIPNNDYGNIEAYAKYNNITVL